MSGTVCSLAFSTTMSAVGFTLLALATSTNFWQGFEIAGTFRLTFLAFYSNEAFAYDRTHGLFMECFRVLAPPYVTETKSPFDLRCHSIIRQYLLPERNAEDSRDNWSVQNLHTQLVWAALVCGAIGWLCILVSIPLAMVALCIKHNWKTLLGAGISELIALVSFMVFMGLWHGADYLRRFELTGSSAYRLTWPTAVQEQTRIGYGWSYVLAWAGIGCLAVSTVFVCISYCVLKSELQLQPVSYNEYSYPRTLLAKLRQHGQRFRELQRENKNNNSAAAIAQHEDSLASNGAFPEQRLHSSMIGHLPKGVEHSQLYANMRRYPSENVLARTTKNNVSSNVPPPKVDKELWRYQSSSMGNLTMDVHL